MEKRMLLPSDVELNSRFIVMTMDKVTLDRPKVGHGRQRHVWILSGFTLKFSAEIFAPYGWLPP